MKSNMVIGYIKILENATNGDMLKRTFPDVEFREIRNISSGWLMGFCARIDDHIQEYSLEWWNTPYVTPK